MQKRKNNIIFILLDSLRLDRIHSLGYPLPTTGFIDYLIETGTVFTNTFTHGCPTQFAFPPIFTSTLPLDHNGYDRGIKDRPVSLPEILKENGYFCVGSSPSLQINKFYHYHRGFDIFYTPFDIRFFWSARNKLYFQYYLSCIQKGNNVSEAEASLKLLLTDVFDFIISYLKDMLASPYRNPSYPYLRKKFLDKYLDGTYEIQKFFRHAPSEFIKLNSENNKLNSLYSLFRLKTTGTAFRVKEKLHNILRNEMKKLNNIIGFNPFFQSCPPAEIISEFALKSLPSFKKPFFLFLHYLDIHDRRVRSTPIKNNSRVIKKYLAMKKKGIYKGDIFYDLSVMQLDNHLSYICSTLKKYGLMDNTFLVICSDHGKNSGYPYRGINSTAGAFYDEFIKVPVIIKGPGIPEKQKNNNLFGLIDLPATILELAGINNCPAFKGHSMLDKPRSNIFLEHSGRGPCDLERKKINCCIRENNYKFICREGEDHSRNEFYAIKDNPYEMKNEINNVKFINDITRLSELANSRIKEIRQHKKNKKLEREVKCSG